MSGGWLDALADYAAAALAAGGEAGAAVGAQLAAALARVEGLPTEAAAAVGELTTALYALLPESAHAIAPAAGGAPAGAASPIEAAITPPIAAAIASGLPRNQRIDPAGLARFIRRQHPDKPIEHAAARVRLSPLTVKAILQRESLGNGRTLLAFVMAYGPEVLAEVLPGANARWLEGARILADQVRLDAELTRTRAEAAANAGRWTLCGLGFGGAP